MDGMELYKKIVNITSQYLGPAANRFISRHIENNLKKPPEKLSPKDIPELISWIKPCFGILTEDRAIVDDYTNQLIALTRAEARKKV
jgi:hypothetical protein